MVVATSQYKKKRDAATMGYSGFPRLFTKGDPLRNKTMADAASMDEMPHFLDGMHHVPSDDVAHVMNLPATTTMGLMPQGDAKSQIWKEAIHQQKQLQENVAMKTKLEAKAEAVEKGKRSAKNAGLWLTQRPLGITVATMVIVMLMLLWLKPDFVKHKKAHELEEPTLSMGRLLLVTLGSGAIVLLVPVIQLCSKWIAKHTGSAKI